MPAFFLFPARPAALLILAQLCEGLSPVPHARVRPSTFVGAAPRHRARTSVAILKNSPNVAAAASAIAKEDEPLKDWLDAWFPVMFSAEVSDESPTAAMVFERPIVLFKDKQSGEVRALHDQCPHRLAPLSDGRLTTDGTTGETVVECSYHGWQFEGKCGTCTKLPQLEASKPIRDFYGAQPYPIQEAQGIVFVYLGANASRAEKLPLPLVPELDQEGWIYEQDYMRDLPYDYTTLVENIIDPSHVPVSHHGTVQGDRSLAQHIDTSVRSASKGTPSAVASTAGVGFEGITEVPLHASTRLSFTQQKAQQRVVFTAPSLLQYHFSVSAGNACALFYPTPVARGRSRVLVRRGRNFATERVMNTAQLVAKHLENNIVFDQDMAFLRGQEARLQAERPDGWGGAWRAASSGIPPVNDEEEAALAASGEEEWRGEAGRGYVMPAQADRFVISWRKQLEATAHALPWRSAPNYRAAGDAPLPRTVLLDRLNQHTMQCSVCMAALGLTTRLVQLSQYATALGTMACLASLASRAPPSLPFNLVTALAASGYSALLLRAYVVGPIIGALSNRLASVPLVAAVLLPLLATALPALSHVAATAVPLALAISAFASTRALETLRSRFIYTEEAKALQIS